MKLRTITWISGILLSYPLYAIGQVYLFASKQKTPDFYLQLNAHAGDWIAAHIFLMAGLILLVPAFIGLCSYFRDTRSSVYMQLSTFFIVLSIFPLFGQFTIDLCLVGVFKQPQAEAYQVLANIQGDPVVKAIFYDNSRLFFFFKYADLTTIGQVFLAIALFCSNRIPVWAKAIFAIALLLTQFGILIHPFYGRIIKRSAYCLFSISLWPVAVALWQSRQLPSVNR